MEFRVSLLIVPLLDLESLWGCTSFSVYNTYAEGELVPRWLNYSKPFLS